jgi:hypothetical protein
MSAPSNETQHMSRRWLWLVPLLILAWLVFTGSGRGVADRFLASLRIARPEAVSVTIPAFSGPSGTHRLQDAVAAMLADSVRVDREQVDSLVGDDVALASRLAGFAAELPAGRSDGPVLTVEGPRAISMTVDRSRLRTILAEAGSSGALAPASVDGTTLTLDTPAGIRAQYGHCPAPVSITLQAQLTSQPPPSADYGDCAVLLERPIVAARVPVGLDMARLTGIALEVAGMSPKQSADFQHILDWRAALALRMPRFIRSYNVVQIAGVPGMLLSTGGRRGPDYELIWVRAGRVHTLAGYGSASDAVPLAASMH